MSNSFSANIILNWTEDGKLNSKLIEDYAKGPLKGFGVFLRENFRFVRLLGVIVLIQVDAMLTVKNVSPV